MKGSKFIISVLIAMLFSSVIGGTIAQGFDVNPFAVSSVLMTLSFIPIGIKGTLLDTIVPPVVTDKFDLEAKAKQIEALIQKAVSECDIAGKMAQETKTSLEGHIKEYNDNFKKLQDQADKLELAAKRFHTSSREYKSVTGEFDRLVKGEYKERFDKFKNGENNKFRITLNEISINDFKVAGTMTSPAGVPQAERETGFFYNPDRPRFLRDIIRFVPTIKDTIEFVRETAITDGTAMQAGQGAAKGQSDTTLEVFSEKVETVATYIVIAKQMLDDVTGLMNYLSIRFVAKLKTKEDYQILYGSGITPNLNGIVTAGDAYNNTGGQVVSINEFDVINKGVTQAKILEYRPNYFIMNPVDVLKMRQRKESTYGYLFKDFMNGGDNLVIGGAKLFETTAVAAGDFIIGDFNIGITGWDRQSPTIEMSDSDANNFTENKITVRFEERICTTIENTSAFVHGTFANALATGSSSS